MHQQVPQEVIQADSMLESSAEKASLDLYKHRWHWTYDPENPDRVPVRDYAFAVGRSESTIRAHAKGYESWLKNPDNGSINEHAIRAGMTHERVLASEAVAQLHGVGLSTVKQKHQVEVNDLIADAKRRAQNDNVPFETAMQSAIEFHRNAVISRAEQRKRTMEQHGLRYVNIESKLTEARNKLYLVLQELQGLELNDRERQALIDSLRRADSVLRLCDLALTGSVEVDWDAELEKLRGVA